MEKRYRVLLLFLLILVFATSFLVAEDMLGYSINSASSTQLKMMARSYGLEISDDDEVLRKRIVDFLNASYGGELITQINKSDGTGEESDYQLKIEAADDISINSSVIVLEGAVKLSFSTSGQSAKTLTADKVILDLDNKLLTAMGNVKFLDSESKESKQELIGDIISYNYKTMNIDLTGGSASSVRKNNDDKSVEFHASGSTISYVGDTDVVVFSDALISTSKIDPPWSIKSEKTALLGSGDMFIFNATLNLGRVPIFWTPAFFYPGTRLVFNPAIGLSSTKGMFINTTTELYGSFSISSVAAKESSSFSTLLRSEESSQMVKDGIVYRAKAEDESLSPLEKWALESKSYMVLVADVYEKKGVLLGIQTKNNFLDSKIKLNGDFALAHDLDQIRFYETASGQVSFERLNLSYSIPYYSDPAVLTDYGNRLSVFTLDSVFGKEQVFPTTYSQSLNSFSWKFNASSNIPGGKLSPWINTISISPVDAVLNFEYNNVKKKFEIKSLTLPSLKTSVNGTLFERTVKHAVEDSSTDSVSTVVEVPFLVPLTDKSKASSSAVVASDKYSISYNWDQYYSNDRSGVDLVSKTVSYKSNGKLSFKSTLGNRWFSFNDTITPSYEYTKLTEVAESSSIINGLSMGIPILGLSYVMDWKVYNRQTSTGTESLKWDKAHVSTHKLALDLPVQAFTLSFTQTLPPTDQSLTPKVSYSRNALSFSLSQKFIESDEKPLKATTSTFNLAYKKNLVNTSLSSTYDISDMSNGLDSLIITQDFNLFFWTDGLCFSDTMKMRKNFILDDLDLRLSYLKNMVALGLFSDNSSVIKLDDLQTVVNITNFTFSLWKGRINTDVSLKIDFLYDFQNKYASSLTTVLDLRFNIAEFMDLTFSVSSSNGGFYRYYQNDEFSFSRMFEDLVRSFDFIGDGRKNTSFNLSGMNVEFTHYMKDWDFHCKYNASVVLSNGSWNWHQTAEFYVQWNAIPDIKVEKKKEWDK